MLTGCGNSATQDSNSITSPSGVVQDETSVSSSSQIEETSEGISAPEITEAVTSEVVEVMEISETAAVEEETSINAPAVPTQIQGVLSEDGKLVFEGTGDDVIELTAPEKSIIRVTNSGNADRLYVTGYDEEDNDYTIMNFYSWDTDVSRVMVTDAPLTMIEVESEKEWTIEVFSLDACEDSISKGDTISGHGSTVLRVESSGKIAKVACENATEGFSVYMCYPYKYWYNEHKELVDTDETSYSGTVKLDNDIKYYAVYINTDGDWTISLS